MGLQMNNVLCISPEAHAEIREQLRKNNLEDCVTDRGSMHLHNITLVREGSEVVFCVNGVRCEARRLTDPSDFTQTWRFSNTLSKELTTADDDLRISYEHIVALTACNPTVPQKVEYVDGILKKPEGVLLPGQSVPIRDDMSFLVTADV